MHSRRIPLSTVSLLLGLAVLLCNTSNAFAESKQPNFLFIFADDQCYETIRAFGHPVIETPNLDRLARSGMTFTHCYNQGSWSGAVCVASRTMLNTGRFLWKAHKVHRSSEKERAAGRFWSEHLKKAGYDTYFSGKWHVRANAEKAFDFVNHVRPGMPNQTPTGYNRPLPDGSDPWSPYDTSFGGFWKGGKHWSEVLGDDGAGYLAQAAGRDKPFFMYLAFNAPHDPRQSPKEYVDRYPLDKVDVPVNYLDEYPYKDGIGCGKNLRDEKLGPFPRTRHAVKIHRQEYYAIITHMDTQVGRLLDALEKSGKKDNTWIFFTADHGLAVGHHGLFGKQNLYDHSVRVPFLVAGPGVPAGKKTDTAIYLQDVVPTTLALAGVAKPAHVHFNSLLPIIRGETDRSSYEAVYGAYLMLQRSVILDGHKLILYPRIKRARLYDLKSDPQEMKDLANSPDSLALMRKLHSRLLDLQEQTGDQLDIRTPFPRLTATKISHSFFVAGPSFTGIIDEKGKEVWNSGRGGARDGYVLPDGNVLIAWGNEVKELTRDHEVVFHYVKSPENKEIGTAQRLANGRTLITELGAKPRILEVDPTGKIAATVPLRPETDNAHMQTRMARKLASGNYLAPHLLAFKVKEYTPTGKVVKEFKTDLPELGGRPARNWPFTAIRLANGNTLVNLTNGNKVVEMDPDGRVVWKVTNDDVPGEPFADPCGAQRLPNGNTIIASYASRKPIKVFELTRDKEIVWTYEGPHRAHHIQILTTNGKPLPGKPLR